MKASSENRRIIVLDTSAFVAGFDPFSIAVEQVTTPLVAEEIRRDSTVKMRLETAVESGKLQVKAPLPGFEAKAVESANRVGDSFKLSKADMQLLALALQLKDEGYTPQIVTDDYSIQNVAAKTGMDFISLATFGIKRQLEWIRYCPACHREYPAGSKTSECRICGTALKRKPKRNPQKRF
jgi:endoribonuclease Nob1